VLFELYRLLRHPRVMTKPLAAKAALAQIVWFREKTGFLHCGSDILIPGREAAVGEEGR